MADPVRVRLQEPVRFSQSLLWQLQRRFFERAGPSAWSSGVVPEFVTSNPVVADAYAEVIAGWLRDWRAAGAGFHPDKPTLIIELGAGSGRFAYHFLRQLDRHVARGRIRYVATDISPDNLDAMAGHPRLRPFVGTGALDFALFDVEQPGPLRLRGTGQLLAPDTVANPVVVIANYVFDGVAHDLFAIEQGVVHEWHSQVTAPPGVTPGEPADLDQLELSFSRHPVTGAPYGDPELDAVIERYREKFVRARLALPVAALQALRALTALAGGRLLLLSADKGYHDEADIPAAGTPTFALHGSVSMQVDYHAIACFVESAGGSSFLVPHRHGSLDVAAFQLGLSGPATTDTARAFGNAIERRGPDDFFTLKRVLDRHCELLSLSELLAWVRSSNYDVSVFLRCLESIRAGLDDAEPAFVDELVLAIDDVWQTHYPLGDEVDVALELGSLLYELGLPARALEYLAEAALTPQRAHWTLLCEQALASSSCG